MGKVSTTHDVPPQQAEHWNGPGGAQWVEFIDHTEAGLLPHGRALIERAAPQTGECVLDIGCGGGATARDVALRVRDAGSVLAVDVSRPILEVAKDRPTPTNLTFALGDAGTMKFPPQHFDLIISRFGVMFFEDPVAAFRHMRGACKAGGRLSFICWQLPKANQWLSGAARIVMDMLAIPSPDPYQPGPFAFADIDRTKRIVADGGFTSVAAETFHTDVVLGSLEQATARALGMGPARQALEGADAEVIGEARRRIEAFLANHIADGIVVMPSASWIVTAKA